MVGFGILDKKKSPDMLGPVVNGTGLSSYVLGTAPATTPNILRSLSPDCAQTVGTQPWASLGLPVSFRPCRVDSCLHFFRVMNTLPDNRHFWKSLVSSVRNWNTINPAPLSSPKSPPRRVKSQFHPQKETEVPS